jgi:hypothetical protein
MTQLSCVAVGLTLGSIIAVAPMIVNNAEWPPLAATATALIATAFGLTLLQPPTSRAWAHAVGVGPLLVWFVRFIVETSRDPTSHNLWPFELAAILIVCVLPASAGVWTGIVFSRRRRGDQAVTAWLTIVAGLAIASVSTWQTARQIAATFHLLGRPERRGATGNLVFCTNQSGEIRRSFWRNMNDCMSSGAIER